MARLAISNTMRIREKRHPEWMKVPLPVGQNFHDIRKLVREQRLHTVCESAHCPNIGECWNSRTATFMILGNTCTRNCHFCAVRTGHPGAVDCNEPERVAIAVEKMELKYAVITSVTRDDLPDGGASIFAETVRQIRKRVPDCKTELLIPDFQGDENALRQVFDVRPDVLNHNLETVPRIYPSVRPQANYSQSLSIIEFAHQAGLISKSGLMLGLGERLDEIVKVMQDLRRVSCNILTMGQYLQPSAEHLPINRYVTPAEFKKLKEQGLAMGFAYIESGPLVRSSYHAASQQLLR
ncbi:lipoyl synthase [candidate division KSB1 bacterium]|nr:lipoyl synthase [candidate division KSB1 bacterium]